jgi:large subunit ribosomal protein L13
MTMKTFRLSEKAMDRRWHVLDAQNVPLGRIASEAARLLLGKHKPTYEPHLPMGDFVVVVNAAAIALTGTKGEDKVYYRHTGHPGGLRERSVQEQLERDPRRVVEKAVKGMLPHNVRGRELFRHLHVYAGPEHPHEAQVNAGTGARARKRAQQAQTAAAIEATTTATRRRRTRAAATAE